MARIRTIKPEFPQSESMGNVSRDARLLFILAWTLCDDHGRARATSRMLASLLYPYDSDAFGLIDDWLEELEREGCIIRYEVDGARYLQIVKWQEHQKVDRPSKSKFPEPREGSRILARPREGSCEDQGSRTKDQGPRKGPGTKDHSRPLDERGGDDAPASPAGADAPPASDDAQPDLPLGTSQTRDDRILATWNAAADIVNEELGHTEWPKMRSLTSDRKKLIKKLFAVYSMDDLNVALDHAMADPWARGEKRSSDHQNWRFDFDYFASLTAFTRFLEAPKNGASPRRAPIPTTGRMAALNAVRERLRRKEQST